MSADGAALGAADLPHVLRRHWRVVVATFGLAMLATLLAAMRITPLYEAHALLTVDYGVKAVRFHGDPDSDRIELNMLNTIRDQMVSSTVLRDTVAAAGLAQSPAYASAVDPSDVLRGRVRAETAKDSLTIRITLADEFPERAEQALGHLLAAYQARTSMAKDDKSHDEVSFLRNQRDEQLKGLEAARADEVAYMNRAGIVSTNPDSNSLTQRLAALNTQLVQVEGEVASGRPVYDQVVRALELPLTQRTDALVAIDAVSQDPAVAEQRRLVALARTRMGQLEGKYGEKHPRMVEAVVALDMETDRLTSVVETASSSIVGAQRRRVEQSAHLRSLVSEQEERLRQYLKSLQELRALTEVTMSRNQIYQTILARLNEAEVDRSLSERRTRIIDPPSVSNRPVNLNLGLFLILAVVLGGGLSLGAAMLAELLDTRVRTAEQAARATGLPILGRIPRVRALQRLSTVPDPEAFPALAEAFRSARAAVRMARRRGAGCERLAVVACGPGEGASMISARLAISLAAMGAKVLLVDGDLREGTLVEEIGLETELGLAQLLAGEPGIAPSPTAWVNLDFLGSGQLPPNPGEMLLSPLLPEMIEAFSPCYDYILVDTPPLSLVADSLSVAEHMDGLLLVVREGGTDKRALQEALARLAPVGDRLIGIILNGAGPLEMEGMRRAGPMAMAAG